jgi:hypothetical protein
MSVALKLVHNQPPPDPDQLADAAWQHLQKALAGYGFVHVCLSVSTPAGTHQRSECSLGNRAPTAPAPALPSLTALQQALDQAGRKAGCPLTLAVKESPGPGYTFLHAKP